MTTTTRRLLVTLALATMMASAGCLGALQKDDPSDDPAKNSGVGDGNNVTDGDVGGDGSDLTPTVVNEAPTAAISITNDQDPKNETRRGFKGDVLKLSAAGSADSDGFIENWTWTVVEPTGEDAEPKTTTLYGEVVKNFQFSSEGVKVITLTVTDNLGGQTNATTMYYRDVSYSYGDEFYWSPVTEPVSETVEHKLPVLAGAAIIGVTIDVDGAEAEIALLDPEGNEHVKNATTDGEAEIIMDHGAPMPGEWTIRVTVTYDPASSGPVPVQSSHEAKYGLSGIVWYGEAPTEFKAGGDGHAHDH